VSRIEQVIAAMAGSSEYFRNRGGTNAGFLNALYPEILGRRIQRALRFLPEERMGTADVPALRCRSSPW
jgi:hypothetical protein